MTHALRSDTLPTQCPPQASCTSNLAAGDSSDSQINAGSDMVPLPFEILTAIFEEVDDVQDLRIVRTASHTLCAAATPMAFRTLSVITTRSSAKNLGRLFDLPHIAAHVREVSYHDTGGDRTGRLFKYGVSSPFSSHKQYHDFLCAWHLLWLAMSVRTSAVHELASSFSRVHQLPQLKIINLGFYPTYNNRLESDGSRVALQASILGALTTSFSIRTPQNLISLSLHNLRAWDLSPLASAPFQTVLPALRRLQLSVLLPSAPDPGCWHHFWSTLCPHMILAPTQHALTELTLHTDTHIGASCGLSLDALHFPHLCALSLRKLVFEPSVGVESFVLRHAATLARLELFACRLLGSPEEMLSSWILSSSTAHAGDEESNSRPGGWDHIWDRFSVELTALIALHVDERRDSWGPVDRYVFSEPERMTYWEFGIESRTTADTEALRRFHRIVASRRRRAGYPEGESASASYWDDSDFNSE